MPKTRNTQVSILLGVVFLAYLGQMMLVPIIAPLAREVGLEEWQVGVTFSMAAIMVVTTSQFWGRRGQSWGRRRVLILALTLATVAMAGFACLAWFTMANSTPQPVVFAFFVLLRGVMFGAAIAAIPTTAQAFIASVTPDEKTRIKGMAGIGAVQGIAMIIGAAVGGALAAFGLLTSIAATPILMFLALLLVVTGLQQPATDDLVKNPLGVSPFDSRVWPFLTAGFGLFLALGFIQFISGFVVQDRLGLNPEQTGTYTGGLLLAAGLGSLTGQMVIVPRSGWRPATLLRVGSAVAVVGFVLFVPNVGAPMIFISNALIGLGIGIAAPGYVAGPTLSMTSEEQGSMAGLVTATNGTTFVIAPTMSTVLYHIWPQLPIIVGAVLMAMLTAFVLAHPRFRKVTIKAGDS